MSEKYVLYLLKNVCKTTVIFAIDVFRSRCNQLEKLEAAKAA